MQRGPSVEDPPDAGGSRSDEFERFDQLFRDVVDGITVQSADGGLVYVNPSAAQAMGFEEGREVLETPIEDVLGRFEMLDAEGEPLDAADLPGRRALAGERSRTTTVRYRVRATGEERWTEVKASPVFDGDGGVAYAINVLHDVTERQQREDLLEQRVRERTRELMRSNEELERFAHVASHDLKEPLRMVGSYLHLLEREVGDELEGEAREHLEHAKAGAQRMGALLEGLLEYARLGPRDRSHEPVDLGEVVEAAVHDLKVAREEADATVTWDELPPVMGDRRQLHQLLMNLLSNAVKHGGPSVHVDVFARPRGDRVEVAVEDDGPGVPERDRERVFEIFQRSDASEDKEGVGVGLAVAQRIAERHGGRVRVESEVGGGSTFVVDLPAVADVPAD